MDWHACHQEDDVPVLDIDKVIEDWFILKAKLVLALHPHQPFTAMIVCSTGYKDDMTYSQVPVLAQLRHGGQGRDLGDDFQ
jgi:hypothetical protein